MSTIASTLMSPFKMYRAVTRTVLFSIATAFYFVFGIAVIPYVIVKWVPHTHNVYYGLAAAMFVTGAISLALAFWKELARTSMHGPIQGGEMYRFFLNISPYLFIGLFGALAYVHYRVFGGFVDTGTASVLFGKLSFRDPLNWLLFVGENLSSAIFLDLMEAYKFKFSSIDYTTMMFGTVVFVFRFVVGVYFWKIIYNALRYQVSHV